MLYNRPETPRIQTHHIVQHMTIQMFIAIIENGSFFSGIQKENVS